MEIKSTKKILFIGAGASLGARSELTVHPPLGPSLCEWLRKQCPGFLSEPRLCDLHSSIAAAQKILEDNSGEGNFEHLVSRLTPKQRVELQRLIQIAFSDISGGWRKSKDVGFKCAPDGYDKLCAKLGITPEEWIVISLNYDVLMEEGFRRSGVEIVYPYFPFEVGKSHTTSNALRVYKPHGSINFFAQPDMHFSYGTPVPAEEIGKPTEFTFRKNGDPVPHYPLIYSGLGAENVLGRASSSSGVYPVMANYTKGKEADINEQTLQRVRDEALLICDASDEIVIVGVNPITDDADDPFVANLLKKEYKKVTFVTYGCGLMSLFKKLYPDCTIHQLGLEKFCI